MARLARVVVAGVAHHVTQRGNRRQETFSNDEDYEAYLSLPGDGAFLDRIERTLHRIVRPAKRGRKPKRQRK